MSNSAASQVAYTARVSETPTITYAFADLANSARVDGWTFEACLAAVLGRLVADREASASRFAPAPRIPRRAKRANASGADHQPTLGGDGLVRLVASAYLGKTDNLLLFAPPGVGKAHLVIALGDKAIAAGYGVQFDTVVGSVAHLQTAHAEFRKLRHYRLLICHSSPTKSGTSPSVALRSNCSSS